jgi:hypothetical protein
MADTEQDSAELDDEAERDDGTARKPVPIHQWREVLSKVEGVPVGLDLRVATSELLALLGVPAEPHHERIKATMSLGKCMRSLGWEGPDGFRMRVGGQTCKGYSRPNPHPPIEPDFSAPEPDAPTATGGPAAVPARRAPPPGSPEELAYRLEEVCKLSLEKLEEVLKLPIDPENGNVLRAITAAAGDVINAQLRADETRLKTKSQGDVMDRLLRIIAREKKLVRAVAKATDGEPPADTIDHLVIDSEREFREKAKDEDR